MYKTKYGPRTNKVEHPCPFCGHNKSWIKSGKEVCSRCGKENHGMKFIKNKYGKKRLVPIREGEKK